MRRAFRWALVLVCLAYALSGLRPPSGPRAAAAALGNRPVLQGGRVKPLDTVARVALLNLRGKQHVAGPSGRLDPIEWLLLHAGEPEAADRLAVFRVDDPDLLALLGLRAENGRYWSLEEMSGGLGGLAEEAERLGRIMPVRRSRFEKAAADLFERVDLYFRLRAALSLSGLGPASDVAELGEPVFLPLPPEADFSRAARAAAREAAFNRLAPFSRGMTLYVVVLLLAALSWLGWQGTLRESAFHVLVLAFLLHTAGLLVRMLLEGRPPVTNLYSSAVFVGWGGVLLALALERVYRLGVGSAAGAALGFCSLLIAHHLAMGGDTMESMQAVLDSNFWLATHVVTITIGYSAVFLAGTLAHLHLLGRVLGRGGARARAALPRMTYGVLCFALFFTFAGTVLGGIWADQAWGRFWGWDPKENGALLLLLWLAIVLHARRAGLAGDRGLMAMAVFGDVVTAFSWFGVNMLGIGLHSYGFMERGAPLLGAFVVLQTLVMLAVLLPERGGQNDRLRSS